MDISAVLQVVLLTVPTVQAIRKLSDKLNGVWVLPIAFAVALALAFVFGDTSSVPAAIVCLKIGIASGLGAIGGDEFIKKISTR